MILATGFSIFVMMLFLHVVLWRWCRPKDDMAALAILFFGVPIVTTFLILILVWFGLLPNVGNLMSTSIADGAATALLYFALAGAYISSYPAAQGSSPSLDILLVVGKSMTTGLTYEDLLDRFTNETVLTPRLQDLIDSNLAVESNGALALTPRGVILVRILGLLRRLLGLPAGKG